MLLTVPTLLVSFALAAEPTATFPPMPKAVSSFGAALLNGAIYIYGGHAGKVHKYSNATASGALFRLKLEAGAAWEELPGDVKVQGVALVTHRGQLIRIGGMEPRNAEGQPADLHSLKSVSRFDPKTKQWQALPDLPEPRSSHDAVVVGDTLYVFGGWSMNGKDAKPSWHEKGASLDLSKPDARWQSIPQPFARRALTMAACDGKIYVICGLTPDGMVRDVNIFDVATQKWSQGPTVPEPEGNGFTPAATVWSGQVFLSPADGKLYRLTAKADAWEVVGNLQEPRTVHRMLATPEGKLIVLGGASRKANGPTAQVEVLSPYPVK